MMAMRKHAPAASKAKEVYLLTGLVVCGKCGGTMVGNRKQAGRNKDIYASYECNNRKRLKNCDMKAIGKAILEEFVLEEVKEKLFGKKAIRSLLKELNRINKERVGQSSKELEHANKQSTIVEQKIKNIVNAISEGMFQPAMKKALSDLETQKASLIYAIENIEKMAGINLSEEMIEKYLEKDKRALFTGDPIQQKLVLNKYVDKVIVFDDRVDVILKIVDLSGGGGPYTVKSTIDIKAIRKH
jgi:site-specific DNA recombinase